MNPIEPWRQTWRIGFLPLISDAGLMALRGALVADDPRLVQGETTEPPAGNCRPGDSPRGACAVCLAAWLGDGVSRVAAIEERFVHACGNADILLGEPGAYRRFIDWHDATPRQQMRAALLGEVLINLVTRGTRVA